MLPGEGGGGEPGKAGKYRESGGGFRLIEVTEGPRGGFMIKQ